MEDKFARRTARFDLLSHAFEADAATFEIDYDLHQVVEAATQPIQAPYHECVPSPQRLATLLKLGPYSVLAARRIFVDDMATRELKRVALQIKVLVLRGDPSISDTLIH